VWSHHILLCTLLLTYSTYGMLIDGISLNSWTMLMRDAALGDNRSAFCKGSDLDRVFLEVDSLGQRYEKASAMRGGKSPMAHSIDKKHQLGRAELLVALLKVAIYMFVRSGEETDVSEALDRLLALIDERLGDGLITSDPDVFRRSVCYTEAVSTTLRKNEPALRYFFDYIATSGGSGTGQGGALISLKEWVYALRTFRIIDIDLNERDAIRCFSWSRMAVVDAQTMRGHQKSNHLPFEGFLEALCRVASLKVMPTDGEMKAAECTSAGEFLHRLREGTLPPQQCTGGYQQFLTSRRVEWGNLLLPEHFERRVEHMISIFQIALEDYRGKGQRKLVLATGR